MGNRSTKSSLRNAIVLLNISADEIRLEDDKFWSQIYTEDHNVAACVISSFSLQEIRMLRDGSPKNFAHLTYKMVEILVSATGSLCNTQSQQTSVIIASKVLTRLLPCIFEDDDWRDFFIVNKFSLNVAEVCLEFPKKIERNYEVYLPSNTSAKSTSVSCQLPFNVESQPNKICLDDTPAKCITRPIALLNIEGDLNQQHPDERKKSLPLPSDSPIKLLIESICDLLFCPEFTVLPRNDNHLMCNVVDAPPLDLKSLPTCEYVWESGVGFDSSSNSTTYYDKSRAVLLKLLLTTQSQILYCDSQKSKRNIWTERLVASDNRHVLPIFTSLLNTIFIYNPTKISPFNRLLFEDNRQEVVELCLQILIAALDYHDDQEDQTSPNKSNLFTEYLSRIHRAEDFDFLIRGFIRLLGNCFEQKYLMGSTKEVKFHQELLILLWKLLNSNSKFLTHLMRTNDVLDIVVPILHHLNENFQDTSKSALIHVGVINLLIFSGERSFGVKLNKIYSSNVLLNLPTFSGSHADLIIIVFHKLILYGFDLNELFDYMTTIVANISPYLKALSILASKCLIQLFEIFSSPMVIFTEPKYHKLVIFLLEIFNNLVQYQFDGNTNLVYVILKHKEAFLNISNMPCSQRYIDRVLTKLIKKRKKANLIREPYAESKLDGINNDKSNNKTTGNDTILTKKYHNQNGVTAFISTPSISQITQATCPLPITSDASSCQLPATSRELSTVDPIGIDDILNEESVIIEQVEPSFLDDSGEETHGPLTNTRDPVGGKTNVDIPENNQEKWRPSPECIRDWKQTLPLNTIMRMIDVLIPQVERFKEDNRQLQDDEIEIIKFLQNGTLVGLLPVPHPILIRKYQTNRATTLWFTACTWGVIYVRQNIWTGTAIKLINIAY